MSMHWLLDAHSEVKATESHSIHRGASRAFPYILLDCFRRDLIWSVDIPTVPIRTLSNRTAAQVSKQTIAAMTQQWN